MQLNDESFLSQFRAQTLDPQHFDHRAHLRVAWLHLLHYSSEEACARVCRGIRELAAALGAPEKFNHTLTEALVRIMAGRMRRDPRTDFEAFLAANADLLLDARGLLAQHYSDQRLNSAQARSAWVEPDLSPIE